VTPGTGHNWRGANDYERALVDWRLSWLKQARPDQLAPDGDWRNWVLVCGRGWGKTRVGAEDIGYFAAKNARVRCAAVGATLNDVRTVQFEGESGLINVIPPALVHKYRSDTLELWLKNGSLIAGKSAEKPDRLRGPQWHRAWCDELASWMRLKDTWDNLIFGLRLGKAQGLSPRTVITTTPRPLDFLRALVKDERSRPVRGSTFANAANLADEALEAFLEVYEGTTRGRQELYAEILDDVAGALWSHGLIEANRVGAIPPGVTMVRVVVAVDPAVTSAEDSDETGIIVAGLGSDDIVYVMHDLSGQFRPRVWARAVLNVYEREGADCIIGEVNQGGDLVEANIEAEADGQFFAMKKVHAKRGKYLRAEPISGFYEKGKVRHVGMFPELENQMVKFCGSTTKGSPDRLDALVYAVGELIKGHVRHDFW